MSFILQDTRGNVSNTNDFKVRIKLPSNNYQENIKAYIYIYTVLFNYHQKIIWW